MFPIYIKQKYFTILIKIYVRLVEKDITYFTILHILSANLEQTNHTLVSYLNVERFDEVVLFVDDY